jgi:chromosome segregation ATPase
MEQSSTQREFDMILARLDEIKVSLADITTSINEHDRQIISMGTTLANHDDNVHRLWKRLEEAEKTAAEHYVEERVRREAEKDACEKREKQAEETVKAEKAAEEKRDKAAKDKRDKTALVITAVSSLGGGAFVLWIIRALMESASKAAP